MKVTAVMEMSHRKSSRPASMSCIAGAVPRYGTCGDVDAHRRGQHHAAEMRGRADAGRAVVHPRGVGLGIGDELLQRLGREILAGDQHQRDFRDQPDRHEIGLRIVERLGAKQLRIGVGRERAEQRRVAVRRGVAPRAGRRACPRRRRRSRSPHAGPAACSSARPAAARTRRSARRPRRPPPW